MKTRCFSRSRVQRTQNTCDGAQLGSVRRLISCLMGVNPLPPTPSLRYSHDAATQRNSRRRDAVSRRRDTGSFAVLCSMTSSRTSLSLIGRLNGIWLSSENTWKIIQRSNELIILVRRKKIYKFSELWSIVETFSLPICVWIMITLSHNVWEASMRQAYPLSDYLKINRLRWIRYWYTSQERRV